MVLINCKPKKNKKKTKIVFFIINFYIILFSILIKKKYAHNYKIVAISYADEKFIKQLKIKSPICSKSKYPIV